MPYPRCHIPRYRKHRASGQAVVTLNGRDFYLGPYGTETSKKIYDQKIAEWTANNRLLPTLEHGGLLLAELIVAFMEHAAQYYRRADKTPTNEINNFKDALKVIQELYSDLYAADFTPLCLRAVRQKMIDRKWARTNINRQISRIKSFFKWAAANQHIPVSVFHNLEVVTGLRKNTGDIKETPEVAGVDQEIVKAVLPHVSSPIAAMLELQLLTGMRPGEVTRMRGCDIRMDKKEWIYVPPHHKMAYRGIDRTIPLVGRAQEIVQKFLKSDAELYLFRPSDADAERRARQHLQRSTPMSCGNRPGTNRRKNPRKIPGPFYDTISYYHAVQRGCLKAFPWPELAGRKFRELNEEEQVKFTKWRKEHTFHPYQIRHDFAMRVYEKCGADACRVMLGHRNFSATKVYAKPSLRMATRTAWRITREFGQVTETCPPASQI